MDTPTGPLRLTAAMSIADRFGYAARALRVSPPHATDLFRLPRVFGRAGVTAMTAGRAAPLAFSSRASPAAGDDGMGHAGHLGVRVRQPDP